MQKVLGFGGVFFRAKDPELLRKWYAKNLGVLEVPTDYDTPCWQQTAGSTVLAPFQDTSDYFPAEKQWMFNFRVSDLDAMVTQLEGAGIDVKVDSEVQPNGRFARLYDPEGNAIELWQEA